jgi:hypothetical protein
VLRKKTRNSRKGKLGRGEWGMGKGKSSGHAYVSCVKTIQTRTDGSEINVSEKYRIVPLVREVREISSRFVLVSELLKSV